MQANRDGEDFFRAFRKLLQPLHFLYTNITDEVYCFLIAIEKEYV